MHLYIKTYKYEAVTLQNCQKTTGQVYLKIRNQNVQMQRKKKKSHQQTMWPVTKLATKAIQWQRIMKTELKWKIESK